MYRQTPSEPFHNNKTKPKKTKREIQTSSVEWEEEEEGNKKKQIQLHIPYITPYNYSSCFIMILKTGWPEKMMITRYFKDTVKFKLYPFPRRFLIIAIIFLLEWSRTIKQMGTRPRVLCCKRTKWFTFVSLSLCLSVSLSLCLSVSLSLCLSVCMSVGCSLIARKLMDRFSKFKRQ